jgi:hypothetical protein
MPASRDELPELFGAAIRGRFRIFFVEAPVQAKQAHA